MFNCRKQTGDHVSRARMFVVILGRSHLSCYDIADILRLIKIHLAGAHVRTCPELPGDGFGARRSVALQFRQQVDGV